MIYVEYFYFDLNFCFLNIFIIVICENLHSACGINRISSLYIKKFLIKLQIFTGHNKNGLLGFVFHFADQNKKDFKEIYSGII